MKGFRFITDIFNVFYEAKRIKNDPDKQPYSVRFGVTSFVFMAVAVVLALGGALLFNYSIKNADELFILLIFTITFGFAFMVGSVIMSVGAILRAVAQLRINKKPIGVFALIVSVLGLIASVIIVAALIN